jgi:hypothetical protein
MSFMLNVIMLSVANKLFMLNVVYAECHLCRMSFMLSVIMLSVVMLSVVMLSVFMLNVIILSVVMLNVVAPMRGPLS